MSTFNGIIKEIPGVIIDFFCGVVQPNSLYFLSHIHKDHMNGLNTFFLGQLRLLNLHLYASDITTRLLQHWYNDYKDIFKPIPVCTPTLLEIPTTDVKVLVIALHAAHCVGSVMFLLETDKRILYTGDIRITVNQIRKYKDFYDEYGNIKETYKIYLDTTFFCEDYKNFPSRTETAREICRLIEEWIEKGDEYCVNIATSAVHGSEFIYSEIYKYFRKPIRVSSRVYENLQFFPDMDKIITRKKASQIFGYYKSNNSDAKENSEKVMKISLSAQRWKGWNPGDEIVEKVSEREYFVCYACHCSCNELLGIINFLKPKKIFANVLNRQSEEFNERMFEMFNECIRKYNLKRMKVS